MKYTKKMFSDNDSILYIAKYSVNVLAIISLLSMIGLGIYYCVEKILDIGLCMIFLIAPASSFIWWLLCRLVLMYLQDVKYMRNAMCSIYNSIEDQTTQIKQKKSEQETSINSQNIKDDAQKKSRLLKELLDAKMIDKETYEQMVKKYNKTEDN